MNVKQWTMRALALAMAATLVVGCSDDPDPAVDAGEDVGPDAELDPDPEPDTDVQDGGDEDVDPDADVDPDPDVDPDADADPAPELTDVELITEVLARGFCEAAYTCAETSSEAAFLSTQLSRFGSLEACVAGGEQWLSLIGFVGPIDAVADGRIILDRQGAEACAQALTTAYCGGPQSEGPPPECEAILEPTRNEGEACVDNEECTGDLACIHEGSTQCYGTCLDPALANACGDEGVCQPWEDCDESGESPTCVPYAGAGDECTVDGDECAEGERCNYGFCEEPEVVELTLLADGEPCSQGSLSICAPGLVCGAVFDGEGQLDEEAGTVCGAPREAGVFCADSSECLFGLRCNDEGVCADLLEDGERCNSDLDCASGTCGGDGVAPVCVAPLTCEVPAP